jgi:hypothetical protein
MDKVRYFAFGLIGVLAGLCGSPEVSAQVAQPTSRISLNDPRPLMKAADLVERRYGIPISYEDPEYLYEGDIHRGNVSEVADPEYRRLHPNASFVRPVDGALNIDFSNTTKATTSVLGLLTGLASQHSNNGNPGRFRVAQLGTGIVIVPTEARSNAGVWTPSRTVLDFRIGFPTSSRSGDNTLAVFCQAVSLASGMAVVRGGGPNELQNLAVTIGANNEVARDVLVKILATLQWADGTTAPISRRVWRLLYSPSEHNYVLSLPGVQVEARSSVGTTTTVWLRR